MKSFVIAAILGIAVIIGSIIYTNRLDSLSKEMLEMNSEIYEYIIHEDNENAIKMIQRFERCLEENKVMLTATGNHEEIEDIELSSKELLEYVVSGQLADARAKSAYLSVLINHMPSNYKLKAENIL